MSRRCEITPAQRAQLLADADRHESLAESLRELAMLGRPSDESMEAAPLVEGWSWASARCVTVRGSWHDGVDGHCDGNLGSAVANLPDMSAILTVKGWFRLGVPDEFLAHGSELVQ